MTCSQSRDEVRVTFGFWSQTDCRCVVIAVTSTRVLCRLQDFVRTSKTGRGVRAAEHLLSWRPEFHRNNCRPVGLSSSHPEVSGLTCCPLFVASGARSVSVVDAAGLCVSPCGAAVRSNIMLLSLGLKMVVVCSSELSFFVSHKQEISGCPLDF